jgi:DNA-binding transcriptional ArsR family regulator
MKVSYSEAKSQIVEQFFVPYFLRENSEQGWDFSNKERAVLQDVLLVMTDLYQVFLPYKERIQRYYLMGHGPSLLHMIFLEMLEEEKEVKTAEDVHLYGLQLSDEKIREHLTILLNTEREEMDAKLDFWEGLEHSTADPASKWHFSQFYRHPRQSMEALIQLSRELVELYQPYLKQGAAERQAYAQSFSLEDFLHQTPLLSQFSWTGREEEAVDLFIVSPWVANFMAYQSDAADHPHHYFFLSCRIDQILGQGKGLDLEEFARILKVISDETRYKVLVELTKPHAKSKAIAQALDITGAAVSFHTQKLINAQLLLLNREDKHIKYNVNKDLLREVIAKIQQDFDLES